MKLFSIVTLLLITLNCSSQAINEKSFAYRNGFQEANYNGKNGKSGENGINRFTIVLFHMAKRGGHGKPGKQGPDKKIIRYPTGYSHPHHRDAPPLALRYKPDVL